MPWDRLLASPSFRALIRQEGVSCTLIPWKHTLQNMINSKIFGIMQPWISGPYGGGGRGSLKGGAGPPKGCLSGGKDRPQLSASAQIAARWCLKAGTRKPPAGSGAGAAPVKNRFRVLGLRIF